MSRFVESSSVFCVLSPVACCLCHTHPISVFSQPVVCGNCAHTDLDKPRRKPAKPSLPVSVAKLQSLRQSGTVNARAAKVQDPLFLEQEFFDPQDLTQVKYEMLRRVQKDALPISTAAARFGFSRPAFYKAERDFTREGLAGLIPRRRGPKQGHKLTPEVLAFAEQIRARDSSLRTMDLVRQIQKKFAVQVHRRTLERALVAAKKKQRKP